MAFRDPTTSLPADAITTGNLTGTYTIIGAIETAASGARVVIDSTGIHAYNAAGTQTVDIASSTGDVTIIGTFAGGAAGTQHTEISGSSIKAYSGDPTELNPSLVYGSPSFGANPPSLTLNSPQTSTNMQTAGIALLPGATGLTSLISLDAGIVDMTGTLQTSVIDAGVNSLALQGAGVVIQSRSQVTLGNGKPALACNVGTGSRTITAGSTVVTTNSSGDVGIATGLSSLDYFVAWNGDAVARPGAIIGASGGTAPNRNVRWFDATGTHIVGVSVRTDWIAVGIP